MPQRSCVERGLHGLGGVKVAVGLAEGLSGRGNAIALPQVQRGCVGSGDAAASFRSALSGRSTATNQSSG